MENIRPQNIYEALLIRRIDPETEIAVHGERIRDSARRQGTSRAAGRLRTHRDQEVREGLGLSRKIIFGRTDLKPHRQYIYDEDGKVATDARYAEYKDFDGVSFPSRIEIFRPQEEYDITLNMLKVDINKPLTDEQFTLEQPAGAEVVHLDRPQSSLAAPIVRDSGSQ